jgi:hypothetical protein
MGLSFHSGLKGGAFYLSAPSFFRRGFLGAYAAKSLQHQKTPANAVVFVMPLILIKLVIGRLPNRDTPEAQLP